MALDADVKRLATGKNFGVLTTLGSDGMPKTQLMWVDTDDDHVLVNTEVHRAKYRDVQRDPRATVTIWNGENPYQYVEVRGRVAGEVRGAEARSHIDSLAKRYMEADTYPNPIESERVILRIQPERVRKFNV